MTLGPAEADPQGGPAALCSSAIQVAVDIPAPCLTEILGSFVGSGPSHSDMAEDSEKVKVIVGRYGPAVVPFYRQD